MNRLSFQGQTQQEIRAAYAAECVRCGACCLSYTQHPFLILVQAKDSQVPKKFVQIGPRFRDPRFPTTKYMRIAPFSRKHSDRHKCAALEGTRCSIYPQRPLACSTFAPGSPACLASRDWMRYDDPPDVMALGRS